MRKLISLMMCGMMLTGCAGLTHYAPSEDAAKNLVPLESHTLNVPVRVPRMLSEAQIDARFPDKCSALHVAAMALTHDPVIIEDINGLASASQSIAQMRSLLLPQVTATASVGMTANDGYSTLRPKENIGPFATSIPVLENGVSEKKIEREGYRTKSSVEKLDGDLSSVILGVLDPLRNIDRSNRMNASVSKSMSRLAKFSKDVKEMQRQMNPVVLPGDPELVDVEIEQTRQRQITNNQTLLNDRSKYRMLEGTDPDPCLHPAPPVHVEADVEKAIAAALIGNPMIEATESDIQAAVSGGESIDGERDLQISASINPAIALGTAVVDHFPIDLSINAKFPLLNREQQARYAQGKAQVKVAQARRDFTVGQISLAVATAHHAMTAAKLQLDSISAEVKKQQVVLDAKWASYKSGQTALRDVMSSEREMQLAEERQITAQAILDHSSLLVLGASNHIASALGLVDFVEVKVTEDAIFDSPDELAKRAAAEAEVVQPTK